MAQQELIGSTPGHNGGLYTLDRTTGDGLLIDYFNPNVPSMNGLAYDPIAEILYGVVPSANQLFSIDPTTAKITPIGQPGDLGTTDANGLAFDPTRGLLYATDNVTNRLYTVDATTGLGSPVGTIGGGFSHVEGLGFDAKNNTLYGLADGIAGNPIEYFGQIITIDTATGDAQALGGPLPSSERLWRGLTFDPVSNGLIACGGTLYWIDPDDGEASYIGGRYVQGLAVISDPLPLSLSLLLDIRPGSDDNPVNSKSNGALPVAIYGSEEIDVTEIDLATLMLEGMSLREKGNSGKLGSFEDINGDSILDLLLHFDLSELAFNASTDMYTLSGAMLDGMALEGFDSIRAVPYGKVFIDPDTLAASWGSDGGTIPEPASLALLAVGGLALIRRRK